MKAEKYLLQYVLEHNISSEKIEADTGINIEKIVSENRELVSDDFATLCTYLNVTPEEVSDQII